MNIGLFVDRVGSVPFIGTIVGVPRCTIGTTVGILAGVSSIALRIFGKQEAAKACERVAKIGFHHAALGLAESIPFIGSIVHRVLFQGGRHSSFTLIPLLFFVKSEAK